MSKYLLISVITIISFKVHADVGAPWDIQMVALSNGETRHIKYNEYTGETWWSKNIHWKKIIEPEPISKSNYEFRMVSTGLSWRTIRLDKLTGEAWKNSKGQWVKFKSSVK